MDSLSALRAHIAAFVGVTMAKAAPPDFNQKHPHAPDGKFAETGDARKLSILVKPSGHIETFDQAVKWWSDNLGGKVAKLTAHIGRAGDGWKKTIPIRVDFPASETHAFTEKAGIGEEPDCYDDPRRKERPRVFVKNRALLMDGIVRAIEYPNVKAVQYGADLLFERQSGGNHYAIALAWSEARGLYVFDSAYSMTDKKMRDIIAHKDTRKNNGPLQKSEPSWSGHSVFRDSTESGSNPTGSKPETFESIGFRRCCNTTIVDLLLLGKSYIDLSEDFDSISSPDFVKSEVFHSTSEDPAPSSLSNERVMELAFDSLDFGQWMLAKSEHGPIPAGAHWIKSEVVTAALLHDFEQITRTYFSGSRSLVRKRIFGQSGC